MISFQREIRKVVEDCILWRAEVEDRWSEKDWRVIKIVSVDRERLEKEIESLIKRILKDSSRTP